MALLGGTDHTCTNECDAPSTTQKELWIVCTCDRKECTKCDNTGKIYTKHCANHYYKSDMHLLRVLYENYTHKNILPFAGSLIEQPNILFKTFRSIDYYLFLRNKILDADKKQKKKAVDAINKRLSSGN